VNVNCAPLCLKLVDYIEMLTDSLEVAVDRSKIVVDST
jgi:hypothetical protein